MAKHIIDTLIISVEQAIRDGHKGFSGERLPKYRGRIPGYLTAFCIEVEREDGTLGSSSNVCLEEWEDESSIVYSDELSGEFNKLGSIAEMCLYKKGNKLTGRIIFNGYYEGYYDIEEREECIRDKTEEVESLWSEYVS